MLTLAIYLARKRILTYMTRPLEPFPIEHSSLPMPVRSKRVLWWVLAACGGIVVVVTVVTVLLFMHHKAPKPAATAQNSNQQSNQPAATATGSSATQQYISNGNDLNLRFTYPSDWSVTPASNSNASDQTITLTSPLTNVTTSSGSTVTAKVILTIRPGNAQIGELASGSATIAQDSTQIGYTAPTASQHQYPYLTFVHLAGGQNVSGVFDEVIITGISKFMKGQVMTADSLGGLDPIIGARFYQCSTNACDGSGAGALNLTNDMWQNSTLAQQVTAVFASLQLN